MRLKINTYLHFCQLDVLEWTVLMSVSEKSVFNGWIHLVRFVRTGKSIFGYQEGRNFLTSWMTVKFPRRYLISGLN